MSAFSQNRRRILSLWLPRLPIDRIKRAQYFAAQVEDISHNTGGRPSPPVGESWRRGCHELRRLRLTPLPNQGGGNNSDMPSIVVIKQNNALQIYALDEAAARYGLDDRPAARQCPRHLSAS